MRDALPNATFIGFTGTPIEYTDKNTPAVFGDYIDVYDIARAVEDGATVKIYYESHLAKVNLDEEGKKLIAELDRDLENEDLAITQQAKAKWTKLEAIVGSKARLENVAADILNHFDARQTVFKGKAMIVTMSRRIAVELYDNIIKLRPDYHSRDLTKGRIKVVMTAASDDGPKMARRHTTKEQKRTISDRLKNPEDSLQMVIVVDMWLTGFDVPCLHTMYIDKPMRGHNLMQAIARVNRVHLDKPGGFIVDYLGIAADLKRALVFYADSGGNGNPTETQDQAAGIKKPDISILSDEFMEEIRGMKHKRLALELLKKLLSDEIRSRSKKNIVQSRTLAEMLEEAIRRYRNKIISSTEVIEELIDVAKKITESDRRGEVSGLSDNELAFYDALAANRSAVEVLGNEKLRELAIVLVDRVRKNATIDWAIKESVRSRMKVIVKRLLRQYGYPPDKQKIATETVLSQAELYAEEWTKKE